MLLPDCKPSREAVINTTPSTILTLLLHFPCNRRTGGVWAEVKGRGELVRSFPLSSRLTASPSIAAIACFLSHHLRISQQAFAPRTPLVHFPPFFHRLLAGTLYHVSFARHGMFLSFTSDALPVPPTRPFETLLAVASCLYNSPPTKSSLHSPSPPTCASSVQ